MIEDRVRASIRAHTKDAEPRPDAWVEIQKRLTQQDHGRAPRRSPTPTGLRHRVLIAAAALLIAAVPLVLLVRAFGHSTAARPGGASISGTWVISSHVAPNRYEIEAVSADGTISEPLNDSLPTE